MLEQRHDLPPEAEFLSIATDPSSGSFFRVAGTRPPTFPNPLPSGVNDRQAWFRTDAGFPNALDPDWVRFSDVLNQQNNTVNPAFNLAFRVTGEPVPEPSAVLSPLALGVLGAGYMLKRKLKQHQLVNLDSKVN